MAAPGPTTTAASSPLAAFHGTAGSATACNAAFLASLGKQALLAVQEEHVLACMLPSVVKSVGGARPLVSLYLVLYLVYDDLVFDDAVLEKHVIFFLRHGRVLLRGSRGRS